MSREPPDSSPELEGLVGTPYGSSEQISTALVQALSTLGRPVERLQLTGSSVAIPAGCDARIGLAARDAGAWLNAKLSSVEAASLAFRAAAVLKTTLQVYHVRARYLAPKKWEFADACFGASADGAQTAPILERHPKPDFSNDAGLASKSVLAVLHDWAGNQREVAWTEHYSFGALPSFDDERLRATLDLARLAKQIERLTEPRAGLRMSAWDGAIVTKFLDPEAIERVEAALGRRFG